MIEVASLKLIYESIVSHLITVKILQAYFEEQSCKSPEWFLASFKKPKVNKKVNKSPINTGHMSFLFTKIQSKGRY